MNNDSGKHRGLRFVTGGRGAIRTILYMATLTACMRKLLTILNAMVRDGH